MKKTYLQPMAAIVSVDYADMLMRYTDLDVKPSTGGTIDCEGQILAPMRTDLFADEEEKGMW